MWETAAHDLRKIPRPSEASQMPPPRSAELSGLESDTPVKNLQLQMTNQ